MDPARQVNTRRVRADLRGRTTIGGWHAGRRRFPISSVGIAPVACCIATLLLSVACAVARQPAANTPVISAAPVGDTAALAACDGKMPGERLVGAFQSTAGTIADWVANGAYPDAPQLRQSEWRSMTPTATAYLCYFDGQFSPPIGARGPVGTGPQPTEVPVDRVLIFIDAEGKPIPPSKYGPSAITPIMRPGGRW
jgi:hypothetical protein